MNIFESMSKSSQQISQKIDDLLKMNTDELYGKKRLHTLSFEEFGKDSFEQIFSLLRDLGQCNLSRIPENYLDELSEMLDRYQDIFNRAKNLSLESSTSPKNDRDSIIGEIENSYQNLYEASSKLISFAGAVGTNFKQLETEASVAVGKINQIYEKEKQKIDKHKQDAKKILEDIRAVASESGVEKTSFQFSQEEKRHKGKAATWLTVLVGLKISFLIFIPGSIYFILSKKNITASSSFTFGHLEIGFLMVASLLFYAIVFCKRNYNAEKHNETMNAYKANVLKTFRAFVDGSDNPSVKNHMLVNAGNAAFYIPSTGFNKSDKDIALPPTIQAAQAGLNEVVDAQ